MHDIGHAIFLRRILGDLGFLDWTTPRVCGNLGAIRSPSRIDSRGSTKHIKIKLKGTPEHVESGDTRLEFVPSVRGGYSYQKGPKAYSVDSYLCSTSRGRLDPCAMTNDSNGRLCRILDVFAVGLYGFRVADVMLPRSQLTC